MQLLQMIAHLMSLLLKEFWLIIFFLFKPVTEWKREVPLLTESTESLPGLLTVGLPSSTLKGADEPGCRRSESFASNVILSSCLLPDDDLEEQDAIEPDALVGEEILDELEEGGFLADRLSEVPVSSPVLQGSLPLLASGRRCWSFNVDASTSAPSTSIMTRVSFPLRSNNVACSPFGSCLLYTSPSPRD